MNGTAAKPKLQSSGSIALDYLRDQMSKPRYDINKAVEASRQKAASAQNGKVVTPRSASMVKP